MTYDYPRAAKYPVPWRTGRAWLASLLLADSAVKCTFSLWLSSPSRTSELAGLAVLHFGLSELASGVALLVGRFADGVTISLALLVTGAVITVHTDTPIALAWPSVAATLALAVIGCAILRIVNSRQQFESAMARYAAAHPITPFRRKP